MSIIKRTWEIFKSICWWTFIIMIILAVLSFIAGFFVMLIGDTFNFPRVLSVGKWMAFVPIILGFATMIIAAIVEGIVERNPNYRGSNGGMTWVSASGQSGDSGDSGPTPGYGGSI